MLKLNGSRISDTGLEISSSGQFGEGRVRDRRAAEPENLDKLILFGTAVTDAGPVRLTMRSASFLRF
ncbi:MAG: hypothetical protein ACYTG0_41535 [Planctomycetota bacterium]|jgi:hypothetical protein